MYIIQNFSSVYAKSWKKVTAFEVKILVEGLLNTCSNKTKQNKKTHNNQNQQQQKSQFLVCDITMWKYRQLFIEYRNVVCVFSAI